MALSKTITINEQITVENAYLKITTVQVITESETSTSIINISAYKDKTSSDLSKPSLYGYSESFIPVFGDGVKDIKAQAYEALKQKYFYADAIDC